MASNPSQLTDNDNMRGNFDSISTIRLRVLAASTGTCYPISLHPNELSVANIRTRLAASLPINDQILLLGPPFKVPKDSLLRTNETINALRLGDEEDDYFGALSPSSTGDNPQRRGILVPTERSGSKRLFLFSKRALSEGAPEPPICTIDPPPDPLPMPTQSDMPPPPPILPSETQSTPLRMALEVYERQFMLNMAKGRAYADGADLRLAACRKCVSEQAVIVQALRAAVSNLADHRSGASRERKQFSDEYTLAASSHIELLNKFDARLEGGVDVIGSGKSQSLDSIPLHPALVSAARSAGRVMESLLDAVPLEQEKSWAGKCRTAHERLSNSFHELDSAFGSALGTAVSWNEYAQGDLAAEESVKALYAEVEDVGIRVRNSQAERLAVLSSNHTEAVRIISIAIKSEAEIGASTNSAFPMLESSSQASSSILPAMEADDSVLAELSKRVSDAKTESMRRMRTRLRQISAAQSAIARANSSVTVLRHAVAQQNEDCSHLEHVVELPTSYHDFITEIRRRRAYCAAFTSNAAAMISKLNSMRADEVKLRERFLRGPGRHLMPAFFEVFAPTLASSPAVFSPQLPDISELETLPNVGEIGMSSLESENTGNKQGGERTSNASTLTDCPSICHPSTSNDKHGMDLGSTMGRVGNDPRGSIIGPSFIVSVDDNSGHDDVIMRTVCHEGSDARREDSNAECATLLYENATLRQALERAGGKPPLLYVNDKTKQISMDVAEKNAKISSMEVELANMKLELEKARRDTQQSRQSQKNSATTQTEVNQCDKISHTSFQVGDVGLFMPTGRGKGGKRIYLAFHSGCPHRYLSSDCITGSPDFVLGRIVYQEEFTAGALESDSNPFGLHVGTKYWVLTVETMKRG